MKELFLDANAHVPMSPEVLQEYCKIQIGYGHPSAPAKTGQNAATIIESSRAKIATLLGTNPQNIFFTSGCTQACEWAIKIMSKFDKIQYSPIEHSAVWDPVSKLSNIVPLKTSKTGVIYTDSEYLPTVCIHVQNEIGTIQPIENLSVPFLFSDMCQSVGKVSICLRDMPVDMAVFGAHKFGGPTSVGFLYLKNPSIWQEFGTGSRYFSDRPGTPDTAGVAATAKALENTLFHMPERLQKMKEFQSTLEAGLDFLNIEIIGKNENRVPNTTFINLPGIAFLILSELSQKGIYVGMGSACGSFHTGRSLVMKALCREGDGHDFMRISQHGEYGKADAAYFLEQFSAVRKKYV